MGQTFPSDDREALVKGIFHLSLAATCLFAVSATAQVSSSGGRAGAIPPVEQINPPAGGSSGSPATGTSGAPATTGATTRTGRVKPPGAPLGAESDQQAEIEKRQRAMDRRVRAGICRGC